MASRFRAAEVLSVETGLAWAPEQPPHSLLCRRSADGARSPEATGQLSSCHLGELDLGGHSLACLREGMASMPVPQGFPGVTKPRPFLGLDGRRSTPLAPAAAAAPAVPPPVETQSCGRWSARFVCANTRLQVQLQVPGYNSVSSRRKISGSTWLPRNTSHAFQAAAGLGTRAPSLEKSGGWRGGVSQLAL